MSTVLPTDTTSVTVNDGVPIEFYYVREPSYTHKLDGNNVRGHVDGLAAYAQAIYKILNTERYEYLIYSWNYGIELRDLIGQSKFYVIQEEKKHILKIRKGREDKKDEKLITESWLTDIIEKFKQGIKAAA